MNKFSDYLDLISRVNNLTGNPYPVGNTVENNDNTKMQWLFHCGMLFSTSAKWWGDFKIRQSIHEGIDITYYRTCQDKIHCFNDSIKVPAMDRGDIINICDDFLGQTIVVEHKKLPGFNRRILFVYAHIIPEKDLKTGQTIKKDEIIARVCDTHKNPLLPPHLHFSCFEVSQNIPFENLNWNLFSKTMDIIRMNPVFL